MRSEFSTFFAAQAKACGCVFLAVWLALHAKASAAPQTNYPALRPPVLAKPAVRAPLNDPVFGSPFVRITDARAAGRPGFFPDYSKRQAWNRDETLLLLRSDDGDTTLFDGRTYELKKVLPRVAGEDVFWHPDNPLLLYYNPGNALYLFNVETEEETLVHEFSAYDFANTRGEGNLSRDGKSYAVAGQLYDAATGEVQIRALMLFDLALRREVSSLNLPASLGGFDWVSVSPLGTFIVVDYATTDAARFNGVEVYDRQFNLLWQKPLGAGHSDLGVDSAGQEFMVMDVYDETRNVTIFKKFNLADGTETELLAISPLFDQHISCRNEARPDWCVISTFDYVGRLEDQSVPWLPFEDEIFALKIDGSGTVERLLHHRSRRYSPATPDSDRSVYFAEPHATMSRSGDRILFGSNWGQNVAQVESVDAYVVAWISSPGPKLAYALGSKGLVIEWTAASLGFVLESRAAFGPGASWQPASETVAPVGDRFQAVAGLEGLGRFYRLRKP